MLISASGSMPNLSRKASITRPSRSGGSREGVPPPKKTVRSGGWSPPSKSPVLLEYRAMAISRMRKSTYRRIPCRAICDSASSPTNEMAKSQ